MKQWFKRQTFSTKILLIMMLTSLIGIIMRWDVVSREASEAIQNRIEIMSGSAK